MLLIENKLQIHVHKKAKKAWEKAANDQGSNDDKVEDRDRPLAHIGSHVVYNARSKFVEAPLVTERDEG